MDKIIIDAFVNDNKTNQFESMQMLTAGEMRITTIKFDTDKIIMNLKTIKTNHPYKLAFCLLCAAWLTFASSAPAQIAVTGSSQIQAVPFTPAWTPVTGGLLDNLAPTTVAGNFGEYGTGGTAANLTTVGISLQVPANYSGAGNLEMCGSDGTAGSLLVYTLPATTYGQNITNITVYGGWQDNGRDAQTYEVYYSTVSAPGTFLPLAYANYNPPNPNSSGGGIGSATRVVISDASGGPMAVNVAALEFVFNNIGAENGAAGYMAITAQGTAATALTNMPLAFTYATQNPAAGTPPTWTIEQDSLIAGQLPGVTGLGNFADFGIGSPGLSALTDGTYRNVDDGSSYATCGGPDGGCGQFVIYALTNSVNGCDITNIITYSGWVNPGRDAQFYHISYATVSAPATFIPITGVFYDPNSGSPISDRVSLHTANGTPLAKNVSRLKFDWTEQANNMANGGSLYAEMIVEGSPSAPSTIPPSPYLVQDIMPGYAETMVGDQVILTAAFSNSPPVNFQWQQVVAGPVTNNISAGVVNANNNGVITSTLTLNDVQVANSGSYQLEAMNATNGAAAPAYSTGCSLVVGSVPAAVNNVIMQYAAQSGDLDVSTNFTPDWTVDTNNDLVYGASYGGPAPIAVAGSGVFNQQGTAADPILLTDGLSGFESYPAGNSTQVACGVQGAGDTMTYTLNTSSAVNGFDLTNITVYGGWGSDADNEQKYEVLYSTVANPTFYISLGTFDYSPNDPNSAPSATRTTLIPASGYLARGVASVELNWNLQSPPAVKGGFGGYSEIVVHGTASPVIPVLSQDINPVTAVDVVGGQLIMTASFANATTYQWLKNGTNIPGATSSTLTLNSLQLSDTATNSGYSLVASNSSGYSMSGACAVKVNPVPSAVNNVVTDFAIQTETAYVGPTWDTSVIDSSLNLILNTLPSSYDTNNFNDPSPQARNLNTAGGLPVLTDGDYGVFGALSDPAFATCGDPGTGAGQWVIYTLPTSVNGYDLTNIIVGGGWNDGGRYTQQYTLLYSTVANPTNFIPLLSISNSPTGDAKTMTRATFNPASGVLARNVSAVYVDFTKPPGVPNGWSGYTEIALFGSPSTSSYVPPTPPTVNGRVGAVGTGNSPGSLLVTGSGGTAFYPYSLLSSTNLLAPLTNWTVIATDALDGSGSFSNAIPINVTNPPTFFWLRLP